MSDANEPSRDLPGRASAAPIATGRPLPGEEIAWLPATEIARRVREKALSPVEVVDATIDRAEALASRLEPFAWPTYEAAREAARSAETAVMRRDPVGPLHGVPTSYKDLQFTRGIPTRAGSFAFADRVPDFDSPVVERLRAAGAISLGKTTMPECGWKGCGDSPLTGISHNPWRHGFNAGGSSTGAAICAAAGIGPLHQGTDGAGSIRMPAAFCGVYGFKPSFGRIAYHPLPNTDLISTLGPLSRTVTDAALFLAATAGADDRDPWSIAGPIPDFLGALEGGIEGWRIAFSPDLGHLRVDPEIAAVVRAALPAFEEAGARVEEVDPGFGDTLPIERVLFPANLAGTLAPVFEQVRERMDPGLVAMIEHGRDFGVVDYLVAQSARAELYQRMVALFSRYVLLVTPSLSVAAFPAGRLIPEHWEQHPWDWLRWAGFSYPFNLTWMPAASVPCGFTADGLPVGLQIAAGRHGDLAVLRASRAFEQARPWADHRPPL